MHIIYIGDMMEDFFNNFNNKDISSFADYLQKLSPLEYISIGCILAITISQCTNPNQQNTLGNFLEMVGQILLTSYAQASVVDPKYISASICETEALKKQIDLLFKKINITKPYYDHNS